jgi:hypothetical protein
MADLPAVILTRLRTGAVFKRSISRGAGKSDAVDAFDVFGVGCSVTGGCDISMDNLCLRK